MCVKQESLGTWLYACKVSSSHAVAYISKCIHSQTDPSIQCVFSLTVYILQQEADPLVDEYNFSEHLLLSSQYPACVDVVDVWPPPHSVWRPSYQHTGYADYLIKLTFSRPILEKANKSYVTLSVSTIKPLYFQPFYSQYSHGSERSLWVYFRVTDSMKYIQ